MSTKPCFRSTMIVLFGMFAAGLLLSAISSPSAANVQAVSNVPDTASPIISSDSAVYLPAVLQNFDPALPRLTSPSSGAVLDTLIPTFSWNMGAQPPDTIGCFALDTNPNPTQCRMKVFVNYGSQWERVMHYNLQPSTLYYWRVGAVYNHEYDRPKWSEERTLMTGPAGGIILPAPILTAPANNSTVALTDLTLTWNPVDGAVQYSISLHDKTQDRWYGFYSTTPQKNLSQPGLLAANSTHEWYVIARNNYAWGSSSTGWSFTTAATGFSITYPTGYQSVPDLFFYNESLSQIYFVK
jgi:hypothetical protein